MAKLPPRTRVPIKALPDLAERWGNRDRFELELSRSAVKELGLQGDATTAAQVARLSAGFVVRYWAWRTGDSSAPNSAQEAALLDKLVAGLRRALDGYGLSVDSGSAVQMAIRPLEGQIEALRALGTRSGRRRDVALRALLPLFMIELEQLCSNCTARQRRRYAKEVLSMGDIVRSPENHPERIPFDPPCLRRPGNR